MALASTVTVVLGTIAFLVFWVLATFPTFPGLPIGRTAGAILGAALMVIFQVASPDAAYAAVDLPILGLLFGTMVVSVYLERADMFKYLAHGLTWKCRGGKDLLCRLCFLIAFSSAIFTNDTCCVVFTEFVLKLCREKNLPPEPFLIALASSANLGSSATPIGNPQNLVIAIQSKISFGKFIAGILPALLVGVTVNTAFLLLMYWQQLSKVDIGKEQESAELSEVIKDQVHEQLPDVEKANDASLKFAEGDIIESWRSLGYVEDKSSADGPEHLEGTMNYHTLANLPDTQADGDKSSTILAVDGAIKKNHARHINATALEESAASLQITTLSSWGSKSEGEIRSMSSRRSVGECQSPSSILEDMDINATQKGRIIWKVCVYLVTLGMLAALLAGLNLSWSALSAAIALMVLDFTDAGPNINKVSYSLLVFFSGMFITVDGFNKTGIPAALWSAMEPHARINNARGVAVLTSLIVFLSNVASNVPTVLLLGPRVAASTAASPGVSVTKSWLILAWASTIAGNLTLVGSAANLIVCEKAKNAPLLKYHLSFWRHLRFGFPATLFIVAIGLPLIRG